MGRYISGEGLIPVLKSLGDNLLGVEVGVCFGHNAEYFLSQCENIRVLVGVDPWLPCSDLPGDKAESAYIEAKSTLKEHLGSGRCKLLRTTSLAASASQFDEGNLDFVYVDGDHSKEAFNLDLRVWYPLVRVGGVVSGHDWSYASVGPTVKEFLVDMGKGDIEIKLVDNNSWYFIKE
jgi:hypothetical protein